MTPHQTPTRTALILGATGKIGRHMRAAFEAAGWQTRVYRRGTDMAAAAMGCDVIVNGLNPPAYHDWARQLPAITTQVIAAARASGATVLFPGNVYVFGTQPGPWSEATPHRPGTRKGRIRAEVEARYRAAAAEGVQTIILRAGDFLIPEAGDSLLDSVYLRSARRGVFTSLGDPQADHAYAWLPDMARAGAMLADRRATLERFTDVPFPGFTLSAQALADHIGRLTGQPLTVRRFGWWMFHVAAPFWELAREMLEMRSLYDHPHRLDDRLFNRLLPDFRATDPAAALAEALENRGFALRKA